MNSPKVGETSFVYYPRTDSSRIAAYEKSMKDAILPNGRSIRFIRDEETGVSVAQVLVDGSVVAQLPSEDALEFLRAFRELVGALVDKKV